MNYLAHSLLAFGDEEQLVGQFAGDFVRGRDLSAHPRGVARGIRLHRHVDAFADQDRSTAHLRTLFPQGLRRVCGIAIDVVADYHLVQAWERHADTLTGASLEQHGRDVDHVLAVRREMLPDALKRFAVVVQRERLLTSWGTRDGVARTLQRLSRRAPVFTPLVSCVPVLWELDEALERHVSDLWPRLVASTREQHNRMARDS